MLGSLAALPAGALGQDGGANASECAEGVITSIDLERGGVFDPESTRIGALAWTYRTLNVLHIETAPSFIRRELLFAEGDCLDPFLLSESARLLDEYGFLAEASIRHEDDGNGGARVIVSTRDEWSTKVDVGVTYDQGPNLERLQLTEENLLGQGIFAELTHAERREVSHQSIGIATPRLLGRTDAAVALGRSRPGRFFRQYVRHPFVGETGRYSFRQGYGRQTDFFSFSTDGAEQHSQVLVPWYRELAELSLGYRLGEPGRGWILGLSLTRDVVDVRGDPQIAFGTNFDELLAWTGPMPDAMQRQLRPTASTRVGLQLGARRYRYEEYTGLDGVRGRQIVGLGTSAGLTIGRGFDVLTPTGVEPLSDAFGRLQAGFGAPLGSSLLHGTVNVETRRDEGEWRDVLLDADLVGYLRSERVRGHTLFFRASAAGGWATHLPYQLSLGGREVVRSLVEDRYPGGRMLRMTVEDRIVLPWPPAGDELDLGLSLFTDVGRVWPGDVPYGVDSGWQTGVGFGLRVGWPSGARNAWRADLVFPVGSPGGGPLLRMSFELNRLRDGFWTGDVRRSRRLDLGPDHF